MGASFARKRKQKQARNAAPRRLAFRNFSVHRPFID
jgi:hypothetical protein